MNGSTFSRRLNKLSNMLGICLWKAALLCGFAVALTSRAASSQEWPQWRGPNRDGIVTSFSEPKVWPEKLKPTWKTSVGAGHSSPVVAAGRTYIHTRQDEREVVSCLDLDTGKLLWQESYPATYTMNPAAVSHGKGPKSTPILSNGKLYTLGISGILSGFKSDTGKLLWRKEFSREFRETSPLFGASMSPAVEDGLVIAHVGGHDQGALEAFNTETGEVKWSWKGDGPGHSSPIIVELGGTRQIVTQTQKYLVGVSASNGELLWSIPFRTDYDQNIVTPVFYQQTLIFSGLSKGTMAIKIIKKGNDWSTEKVWENPGVSMYMNSPVLSGDLLFGLSHRNKGQVFLPRRSYGINLVGYRGSAGGECRNGQCG
jgi:outer membrane protein assembly factor BamB